MLPRFGIRAQLLTLTMALLCLAGAAAGLYIEDSLRTFLEARVENELKAHARVFRVAYEGESPEERVHVHPLARSLGEAAGVRLTFIAPDGTVLADTDVPLGQLGGLHNHKDRPEVAAALAGEEAVAQRESETIGERLVYAALPVEGGGVARAAMPLAEVDALISQVRVALFAGGAIALLVALLMGGLASHLSTLTLRRMVMRARKLSHTEDVQGGDELDYLMGSFETMADELRRTLRSLAKARDRFEVVVEGMDQAVFRLSAKKEIKLANRAALELLGLEEQPLGKKITRVVKNEAILRLVESDGDSDEIQLPSGRRVLAQHSKMRLSRGSILVLHDVTHLRRLEAVRRDFVANVSHELRTPISVIRANTEALLDNTSMSEEQRQRFLEALHRASIRLSRLVADLLDLAKIESGHFVPDMKRIRVADAIGLCADAVAARIEERGHDIELDLEEGLAVRADAHALEQILVNFLDNAAKYTPPGGQLALRAHRSSPGRVRIEVVDNGPGIDEDHRERLFERFYRVDPGRSKAMGGTGLGLAIVKHLAHAIGGDVGMEPVEPHGARFWVELSDGSAAEALERDSLPPEGDPDGLDEDLDDGLDDGLDDEAQAA